MAIEHGGPPYTAISGFQLDDTFANEPDPALLTCVYFSSSYPGGVFNGRESNIPIVHGQEFWAQQEIIYKCTIGEGLLINFYLVLKDAGWQTAMGQVWLPYSADWNTVFVTTEHAIFDASGLADGTWLTVTRTVVPLQYDFITEMEDRYVEPDEHIYQNVAMRYENINYAYSMRAGQ